MADPSRTVRLRGLPADMDEDLLKDKLFIHFLRARNGGGDIESITIVQATPPSALIVFEEREVAKTVVERSPHVLEVKEKKYNLSVTLYHEVLDPDKVVKRLSAVMDYSQVPGGALALKRLQEDHPDIRLSYDAALELHTLHGAYSKVQAALTQLFGQSGNQQSDTVQPATSGSLSERLTQKPSGDLSLKPNKQTEQSRAVDTVRSPEHKSSTERETTPGAYGVDDTGQREGANPQLTWPQEEDSLLIVDADMFQYLQKYCKRDYEQILSLHGVEAVVVMNQGLTSLYLRPAAGGGATLRDPKGLSSARHAMSRFFQENETKICQSEFLKSSFSSGRDLQMAKDSLHLRHPKILLKEDEKYVYMIGNSRDVYDAKQFLLDRSLETFLKTEEHETKDEVARRGRLAPRFKESGVPSLGNRSTDFCLRGGPTSQSKPKYSGPMLGFNVLSEPSQIAVRVPRASPQSTGEDILFKGPSSLPPTLSMQSSDTLFNSDLIRNQPKMASLSTPLQDSTLLPPAVSGSTLKRANSFSGISKSKAPLTQQRSQDDTIKSTADPRTQSSGLSDHLGKDRHVVYKAEIVAFYLMWQYIREVYSTQVDDLTSDVLMKEAMCGGSSAVTITLSGLCPSTLKSCRLGLQKLIDSVDRDFSVHKLALSDLGLTDPTHETLLACCNNARDSFRMVTIHIKEKDIMLLGPSLLCSQVAASLLEVFSRDLTQMNKRLEFPIPSTPSSSKCNQATLIQTSEDQSAKLHSHRKSHVTAESRRGTTDGASIDQERRTNHSGFAERKHVNGSAIQPRQHKDAVIKEKVKYIDTRDRNGQKASVFGSKPGDNERENSLKSVTFPSEDASLSVKESLDSALKDSAQQKHKESEESRPSTEAELLRRGIRGQMSWSRLNINIQGYKNDLTIKVIYYIPDGIQGEGHPSPGKPFQGGMFEAYFPDTGATRRLLPRLEQAFKRGLTFNVVENGTKAKVTWSSIPHKTSLQGGKSGSGYPDSTYLDRLADILTSHGIEESPAKCK